METATPGCETTAATRKERWLTDRSVPPGGHTPTPLTKAPSMSNARRFRRRWITLQREIDLDAGLWCPICQALSGHYPTEGHPGDQRVVTEWDVDLPEWLVPDKQETPGIAVPEVSTNRTASRQGHGGCSPKRKG